MISARITGVPEVIDNLKVKIPLDIKANIGRNMLKQVILLQRYIILNKLEGQVLHHRTGHLERSINYEVRQEGSITIGIVGVGREAPYGKVHEDGGTFTIPQHLSKSKLGKSFSVRAHSATFPKRAFLRTSLAENHDTIVDGLTEGAV